MTQFEFKISNRAMPSFISRNTSWDNQPNPTFYPRNAKISTSTSTPKSNYAIEFNNMFDNIFVNVKAGCRSCRGTF